MTGQFMGGMQGIPAGMIGGPMTNQAGQYAVPPQIPGVYLGGQSTTTVATPAVQRQAAAATNAGADSFVQRMYQRAQRSMTSLEPVIQNAGKGIQGLQNNALFPRGAMLGGALMPAMQGVGEITQGEIGQGTGRIAAGAGGAFVGGKAGGAAAKALTGSSHPLLKLGGIAVGALAGGNVMGAVGAAGGGYVEDKIGGVTGRGDSRGAQRKRSEQDTDVAARNLERMTNAAMNPYFQNMIQLNETAMNNRITELQRTMPMMNEFQNQQLVRQQALNASQASNYMAMGTVATAGRLATGAQEQAGMNLRAAMTTNPYAGNTLQAPNINFG